MAKRAVMIHLCEAQIFERQVLHALQCMLNVGSAAAYVFQQIAKLLFRHAKIVASRLECFSNASD